MDLVTVTGVECDPDLRHATVYFSSLGTHATEEEVIAALEEHRVSLQAAVGSQVRMKRTPQLRFAKDPAIAEGLKMESIFRQIKPSGTDDSADDSQQANEVDKDS